MTHPVPDMSDASQTPLPPEPFVSWLDFAVARLPVRELELEGLFDENPPEFNPEDFRRAAQAELAELRKKAGESDSFPDEYRTSPVVRGHP